ncbi:shikimate kinase [Desulfotalea psychrophila]|uniref:Shikimate kinase n=1 Tax=Desulfotalea psychrophila (strain LSv54 / DSM 12343) TaxID=177439 RepID=Q6AQ23_DESPS|nr:shikimate kinase [Desulfotalea psychrophila]CAG35550.1 probable shikimate kinase [Desulfotalea psychrophila LSv54]
MIFLVGYRAVGKTTLGKKLAREIGADFVDLDRYICEAAGRTVEEIVAVEGWQGFRLREREAMLAVAAEERHLVVATGGGAVLHQDLWPMLKKKGFVVWLTAEQGTLCKRLSRRAQDPGRPSLTGQEMSAEVEKVLRERLPLYDAVADVSVATDRLSIVDAIEQVLDYYRKTI